jgi:hypothetical protein
VQIQVISKTGTNRISGSLFEFVRNDVFDAKDPFLLPTDSKKLNRHQFGGTIGGPLPLPRFGEGGGLFRNAKNKSFFFASYDGLRERRSVNASTQAPPADWLKGDFRNLPFVPAAITKWSFAAALACFTASGCCR